MKNQRYTLNSPVTDYEKGYAAGMKAAFDESELDAYYTGVGYAKCSARDRRIGFNSDEEREEFEKGMKNKDRHFKSHKIKRPSVLSRVFGLSSGSPKIVDSGKNKRSLSPKKSKTKKSSKKRR